MFLGLGLISPQIVIDMLALKGYFGNKRVCRNVAIMIDINEQFINQVSGVSSNWDQIKQKDRFWNLSWVDSIASKLQLRRITICNNTRTKYTENKTLIDYCMVFSESVEVRRSVNCVRLHKGVFLPIELVREKGKKISDYFI